jgi:1-acyl-sn-glycerol-3-phosphate acyltransferase
LDVYQALTYETVRLTIGPLVSAMLRLKGEGEDNIPAEGGALIVINHRNPILDPMCVALRSERIINFVAASVAFGLPVVSQLFKGVGAMPLDVFGGEKSKEGLDHVVQMVQDGELVGVFPEGVHTIAHLHSVSKIRTFRTGFARIALQAKVPIIPVAVIGTGERNLPTIPPSLVKPFFDHPEFQKGVQWTYYKRAFVRIGRPLDLSGYFDQDMTKEEIDQISGKVRRIIIKLYDGEDRERFVTGELPFDIAYDRV